MKKTQAQAQAQAQNNDGFMKAKKPTDFLEGKYFKGLVELYYLTTTGEVFYPTIDYEKSEEDKKTTTTFGIIKSAFMKDIIELKENELGIQVRNFDFNNKYLVDDNGEPNTKNVKAFNNYLKEVKENGIKIFSYVPISNDDIMTLDAKFQKEKADNVSKLILF